MENLLLFVIFIIIEAIFEAAVNVYLGIEIPRVSLTRRVISRMMPFLAGAIAYAIYLRGNGC